MRNFFALLVFIVIYIPLLLWTFVLEGLMGVKTYIYDAHQTLKYILFELGLDFRNKMRYTINTKRKRRK